MGKPPDSLAYEVLNTASVILNRNITDLPSLSEEVDPDILAQINEHENGTKETVNLTFSYSGIRFSVSSDGGIDATDFTDPHERKNTPNS